MEKYTFRCYWTNVCLSFMYECFILSYFWLQTTYKSHNINRAYSGKTTDIWTLSSSWIKNLVMIALLLSVFVPSQRAGVYTLISLPLLPDPPPPQLEYPTKDDKTLVLVNWEVQQMLTFQM